MLSWLIGFACEHCFAAGGVFVVTTEDETLRQPIASRMELYRADGKPQIVRQVAGAGRGVVVSEAIELTLPDGQYQFRFTRGPEYRIIQGTFTLERTSDDARTVTLPRMVDMKSEGWLSCDMAVPPATENVRLRMLADDLHFAAILDAETSPTFPTAVPKNIAPYRPIFTIDQVTTNHDGDVLFYPATDSSLDRKPLAGETTGQMIERISQDETIHIAVANPFAWELPLWLASEEIDGMFLFGDWLREDKRVEQIREGRPAKMIGFDGPRGPGRYAEYIYWNLLEAGLRIAPLAGTGTRAGQGTTSPIGYNRVYATGSLPTTGNQGDDDVSSRESLADADELLQAVWSGQSVVTNGPMLRPSLGGYPPGHIFTASNGETLHLDMALELSVRDEVDYVEIIHNGKSFHSARLDEFAQAGGKLPEMVIQESGWVMVRVVTAHEDHYRLATSAPWFIEFESKPRISREAVNFFGKWLIDAEQRLRRLPANEIAKHVPAVTTARRFWTQRLQDATVD